MIQTKQTIFLIMSILVLIATMLLGFVDLEINYIQFLWNKFNINLSQSRLIIKLIIYFISIIYFFTIGFNAYIIFCFLKLEKQKKLINKSILLHFTMTVLYFITCFIIFNQISISKWIVKVIKQPFMLGLLISISFLLIAKKLIKKDKLKIDSFDRIR